MPRRGGRRGRGGRSRGIGRRRRAHHRIGRRSGGSRGRYVAPPVNDANNFFFRSADCSKYDTYGYTP